MGKGAASGVRGDPPREARARTRGRGALTFCRSGRGAPARAAGPARSARRSAGRGGARPPPRGRTLGKGGAGGASGRAGPGGGVGGPGGRLHPSRRRFRGGPGCGGGRHVEHRAPGDGRHLRAHPPAPHKRTLGLERRRGEPSGLARAQEPRPREGFQRTRGASPPRQLVPSQAQREGGAAGRPWGGASAQQRRDPLAPRPSLPPGLQRGCPTPSVLEFDPASILEFLQ